MHVHHINCIPQKTFSFSLHNPMPHLTIIHKQQNTNVCMQSQSIILDVSHVTAYSPGVLIPVAHNYYGSN